MAAPSDSQRAGGPGIIDAWAQLAVKGSVMPEVVRLFQQSGSAQVLETGVTPAEMVAQMDQAGIERALLCAWHRPGGWVVSNDTIAQVVREYPDRFVGMAAVDLEKPVAAVRELERAVTQLGFKALRVVPWLWNRPPNDKLYYPLYVRDPTASAGGLRKQAHSDQSPRRRSR